MKIVMIGSSFRTTGNTEHILDLLQDVLHKEAEAQRLNLEIDRLSLSRETIQPCRGCRLCFERGEEFCPNRDSVLSIQKKLESADAVVAASPVYVEDVNGIMKTWIDRMAFNCHRPAFCGKCAAVLTTSEAALPATRPPRWRTPWAHGDFRLRSGRNFAWEHR